MRIAIADGSQEADYIINQFQSRKNKLYVINSNMDTCKYLSKKNHINVYFGKINKEFDLRNAQIEDCDLFIALSDSDIKNYVSCQMAKLIFKCKKVIARVKNPKNVDTFKNLGVDSVICSTYLLGETIKSELSIEDMISTLAFEGNKIIISEIVIKKDLKICKKALKDIDFPEETSVCCVYRSTGMIIPNGETVIEPGDKVLVVSSYEDQKAVKDFILRR